MIERPAQTVYEFSAPLLDGRMVDLAQFRGRVLLIVNTASQCGFTPQYVGLQELYRTYNDRGFEVLGFPCNQFGAQEPDSEAEIGVFCEKNFGVSFPVFAKIEVNGPRAHPFYRFLKREAPGIFGVFGAGGIKWNFTKFLVDRKGKVVRRYGPSKEPKALARAIEGYLRPFNCGRDGRCPVLCPALTETEVGALRNELIYLTNHSGGRSSSVVSFSLESPRTESARSDFPIVRSTGLHIISRIIRSVKNRAVPAARTRIEVSEVIAITCSPSATYPASEAISTAWTQRLILPQKIRSALPIKLKSCPRIPCPA